MRPTNSTMSSVRVITSAPARSNAWHPVDADEVTGPGTAPTTLPNTRPQAAVLAAPLRRPASTTTAAPANAATNRLRVKNRCRAGRTPGGYSVTSNPSLPMRCNNAECPAG